VLELLRQTARTLRAHAFRFALTSLGVGWGAFMLVYLTASVRGLDLHYTREIAEVGPRIVWMFPGVVIKEKVGERGARAVELEVEDAQRLPALASVARAAPNIAIWAALVRAERRTKLFTAWGVGAESQEIRHFEVEHGRFLSPTDVERAARVAFLGREAALRLFGRSDAVGETVQVESLHLRVVGVARGKGDQLVNMGGQDDKSILIPYTTVQRWFRHDEPLPALVFEPTTAEESWDAIRRVRELTALHEGFDPELDTALGFVNIQEVLGIVRALGQGLRLFLVTAGLITIAVGAVGVMNIMLVVVAERRREIGLRKALGARDRDVFAQFLAEASAVCVLSGAAGALAGAIAARLMAAWIRSQPAAAASPPDLSWTAVVGVAAVLAAVGVAAGLVPALRAARVDPSESLRAP
jgi:putative ABC transport system permease protein